MVRGLEHRARRWGALKVCAAAAGIGALVWGARSAGAVEALLALAPAVHAALVFALLA